MFFSFDGVDGAGKSTQIRLFTQWLSDLGHTVVQCRDPGTTLLGEALRDILLHSQDIPVGTRAEMLIYMAARSQLVDEVIRPALAAGKTVVSDRFLLSNVVYQGHAAAANVEEVWSVGRIAVAGVLPDLTVLLDIDPNVGLSRMNRQADRLESRGLEYLNRVRQGFLHESRLQPDRIVIVDADRPAELVQREIQELAARLLGGGSK